MGDAIRLLAEAAKDLEDHAQRVARAKAIEECARVAEQVGRPVGAGDGETYVPRISADAARAIRSLAKEPGE